MLGTADAAPLAPRRALAGFEDLIRDTLAKQGEPTHANRARVYATARATLERMIGARQADGTGDADAAQAQREQLEAAIERIEDEHALAFATPPSDPETMQDAAPPRPDMGKDPAPIVAAAPAKAAPRVDRRDAQRNARLLDGRPRRRPFAKLLLWTIILSGIVAAGWWAWTFGPSYVGQLGPVPNPVQLDVPADSGAAADDGWITIFDPAGDIAAVTAGETASTQVVRENGTAWLRLATSADPDDGDAGRVRVAVPSGIMASLAGQGVTFEVNVRSAPGVQPHPFSILCEFPEGSCNRTRFEAGLIAQPFVFNAKLGQGGEAGALVIESDLESIGRAIDLGPIRIAAP